MKLFKYFIIGIALVTNAPLSATKLELAEQLLHSYRHNQLIPLVSASHPHLSVEQAYVIQRHYVTGRLAKEKPAGFKAGLTSKSGQQQFNVNQPLAGVLLTLGDLSQTPTIQLSAFKRLMIETEIGFEIGTPIQKPIQNPTALQPYIKAVFPVIELPELGFVKKPTGIDIIAANVGAAAYLKGSPMIPIADIDLNQLQVTLTHNGKVENVGQGHDVLGDQWQTAVWLVNTLIDRGWTLKPGQFLITGALGKMVTAKIGHYQANFGELGQLSFTIIP